MFRRYAMLATVTLVFVLVSCSSTSSSSSAVRAKTLHGESEHWKAEYTLKPVKKPGTGDVYLLHETFKLTNKNGGSGGKITLGGGGGYTVCGPVKGVVYAQSDGTYEFTNTCEVYEYEIIMFEEEKNYSMYIHWSDRRLPLGSMGEGLVLK